MFRVFTSSGSFTFKLVIIAYLECFHSQAFILLRSRELHVSQVLQYSLAEWPLLESEPNKQQLGVQFPLKIMNQCRNFHVVKIDKEDLNYGMILSGNLTEKKKKERTSCEKQLSTFNLEYPWFKQSSFAFCLYGGTCGRLQQ